MSNHKYAVLQEMNDKEVECWLYFIKYEGNEEALKYLQEQLEEVEWSMLEDGSTFDLDLKNLVSELTAKEMTKVELNHYQWHRKFDGILDKINFMFNKKDDEEDKINKVCDLLSYGEIDNFIDEEDIDEEDLTDNDSDEDIDEEDLDNILPPKECLKSK